MQQSLVALHPCPGCPQLSHVPAMHVSPAMHCDEAVHTPPEPRPQRRGVSVPSPPQYVPSQQSPVSRAQAAPSGAQSHMPALHRPEQQSDALLQCSPAAEQQRFDSHI